MVKFKDDAPLPPIFLLWNTFVESNAKEYGTGFARKSALQSCILKDGGDITDGTFIYLGDGGGGDDDDVLGDGGGGEEGNRKASAVTMVAMGVVYDYGKAAEAAHNELLVAGMVVVVVVTILKD
ncbi:hypothetical protein Syun_026449 [Stephania yunnanensis]|uniref:Uncharacterized protein n=1 Tax=Stephania yunnanensis TaxID=152371 RepID=A0AAP0HWI2_9MAGN